VVEATVLHSRIIRDKDDPEGIAAHVYELHADRTLRGQIGKTIQVYDENTTARATFDWKIGRKYLLFLSRMPNEESEEFWWLDNCGSSGPLSQANAALTQIAEIEKKRNANDRDGFIHGIVSLKSLSSPLPGVRVEALGTHGHYSARTDSDGKFNLKVPAGQYLIRATEPGWVFDTADISYEDRHKVRVERGGCIQLQLAGVEGTPPQEQKH
jgi:hypothetical protein